MDPMRAIRRAWAAFIGATFLGYSYLMLVPPLDSRTTDTIVAWGLAAGGAIVGSLVEGKIVRAISARRAQPVRTEATVVPSEALIGG